MLHIAYRDRVRGEQCQPLVIILQQNPVQATNISTLINVLQEPSSSGYQMTNEINPFSAIVLFQVSLCLHISKRTYYLNE
jgi:hypothetical protein